MDLRIVTNPHLETQKAEEFATALLNRRRELWQPDQLNGQLDKDTLDRLKAQLKNINGSIGVK